MWAPLLPESHLPLAPGGQRAVRIHQAHPAEQMAPEAAQGDMSGLGHASSDVGQGAMSGFAHASSGAAQGAASDSARSGFGAAERRVGDDGHAPWAPAQGRCKGPK